MELGIYSIRDKKIGYGDPIILNNDETAIRAFTEWVNSENKNQANQFLEDKEFYKIGKFEDKLGTIIPENTFLTTAIEVRFIRPEERLKKKIEELENRILEEKQKTIEINKTAISTTDALKERLKTLEDELKIKQKENEELRKIIGGEEDEV